MLEHIWEVLDGTFHVARFVTSPSFIATSILASAIIYVTYQLYFHPLAKVPGPRLAALTRVWYAAYIAFGEVTYLTVELHKKYGPAVRIAPNEVVFDTVDAAKEIYRAGGGFNKTHWYDIAKDDKTYLFTPEDHYDLFPEQDMSLHRVQRRLVGPPYALKGMKRHETHVNVVIKSFMNKMMTKFAGKVLELDEWLHMYILDSLAQMTVSARPEYIEHETDGGFLGRSDRMWHLWSVCGQWKTTTFLIHLYNYVKTRHFKAVIRQEREAKIPNLFTFSLGHLQKRMVEATGSDDNILKYTRGFYDFKEDTNQDEAATAKAATKAKEAEEAEVALSDDASGPTDILADLLQIQLKRSETWTKQWTIGMCMTNFGAGHDTTLSTLTSILVLISMHPTVLSRVRADIASAISSGSMSDPVATTTDSNETTYPSYDEMFEALPYLDACIKEAMRIRPIIGLSVVRYVPAGGAVIEGHFMPAGTIVGTNPFALNCNEQIFGPDAREFKPERWISMGDGKHDDDEHSADGHANGKHDAENGTTEDAALAWSRNNLSWGGPSRTCPGQHFARIIMLKLIVVLLRSVRLEIVDGWKESKTFLARMCDVKVKVVVDPVEVEGKTKAV